MQLSGIDHVAIICSDYARSKRFYTEVLGLTVIAEAFRAARQSHKLDLAAPGGARIELFSFPGSPSRLSYPEALGLRHLAFAVTDLDACVTELEGKGVKVEAVRLDEVANRRFTFFADPDDLPIELYEAQGNSSIHRTGLIDKLVDWEFLGLGKGSNAAAIADACAAGTIPARVAVVISDVAGAGILEQARARGLAALHVAPGKFRTRLDGVAEAACLKALRDAEVDLVVLAGFMRILKGEFLRAFAGKVVNIHPALLPAFPGLEAWKQALDYGVKMTGVTVHFVDQGIDTGPIIAQETAPVLPGDTSETLHARIQEIERKLYPAVIGALARGEIRVEGRRAIWQNHGPQRA